MWGKVVHQRLEFIYISGCQKLSFECSTEKMLCFVQRSPRDFNETSVILKVVAASAFSDVRSDAVGAPYNLPADGVTGKPIPAENDIPNGICKFLRQLVNAKIFEVCPVHNS